MLITSQVLPLKRSNFACSCMKMVDVNAKNRGGGPDLFGEKIEGEAENGTMSFTRSYQPPQHRDKVRMYVL